MLTEIRLNKNVFKHWWLSLIMGIISIVAGICCFVTPINSLTVMRTFFVALLITGGIFNVISTILNRKWNSYWGWDLARGIIEILLGIWLSLLPVPLMTTMLVYVCGIWMLFHSILGICESCELSNIPIKGWGWLLACNILCLLCSFIFLTTPIYGGIFVLAYIAASFILYGIFRIILAFQFRKFNKQEF